MLFFSTLANIRLLFHFEHGVNNAMNEDNERN